MVGGSCGADENIGNHGNLIYGQLTYKGNTIAGADVLSRAIGSALISILGKIYSTIFLFHWLVRGLILAA
jgi:hypothetical protein